MSEYYYKIVCFVMILIVSFIVFTYVYVTGRHKKDKRLVLDNIKNAISQNRIDKNYVLNEISKSKLDEIKIIVEKLIDDDNNLRGKVDRYAIQERFMNVKNNIDYGIEDIKNDIEDIKKDIEDIKNDIEDMKWDIEYSIKWDIEEIKDDVSDMKLGLR